jgi:transposase
VDLEERVPKNHPLRLIRRIVNDVLAALDREFAELYAAEGRPSIAPERLLRALLLQAFYTIRSERQLMEQLHYNLLSRWFVGLGVDDPVWVPTVFTKNRDRLLEAEVARKFLAELLAHKEVRALLSDEHFSVDGTQIAAWASMKSLVAKDGSGEPPSPGRNGERDFHGEQRSNETHASTTDPEAKLSRPAGALAAIVSAPARLRAARYFAPCAGQSCGPCPGRRASRTGSGNQPRCGRTPLRRQGRGDWSSDE